MNNKELVLTDAETKPLVTKKQLYLCIKRIFDIICSLFGLIFFIISYIFVKIAYMLTGDFHRVLFTQDRIGKNGKHFKLFKFRSMVPNGEEVLKEMMEKDPKIREEYTKNKKLENDPRITKVGKVIRKCSIDELPQFINIFIGNMSLVGPRPYLPGEKNDMGKYYDYVITCKPGLTGLWQVSGRSDIDFNNRLKLDKKYALERGLKGDIKIIFKTFGAVFGKKGAK